MQQVAVVLDDSLGLSGGARGIEDPTKGIWRYTEARVLLGEAGIQLVDVHQLAAILGQFPGQSGALAVGHDEARLRVTQHVGEPGMGVGPV